MCVFVPVCLSVRICIFCCLVSCIYVNSIPFSTLHRQNLPPGKPLVSGLLEHSSDGGVFPSDVKGMYESTDGFLVKSIRIYS